MGTGRIEGNNNKVRGDIQVVRRSHLFALAPHPLPQLAARGAVDAGDLKPPVVGKQWIILKSEPIIKAVLPIFVSPLDHGILGVAANQQAGNPRGRILSNVVGVAPSPPHLIRHLDRLPDQGCGCNYHAAEFERGAVCMLVGGHRHNHCLPHQTPPRSINAGDRTSGEVVQIQHRHVRLGTGATDCCSVLLKAVARS